MWAPATEQEAALFRIKHDDDDVEDLDEQEVDEAIKAWKERAEITSAPADLSLGASLQVAWVAAADGKWSTVGADEEPTQDALHWCNGTIVDIGRDQDGTKIHRLKYDLDGVVEWHALSGRKAILHKTIQQRHSTLCSVNADVGRADED